MVHAVHVDKGGHILHGVHIVHAVHVDHVVHILSMMSICCSNVHLLRVQNLPSVVVILFVKQVYFDFANQGAKLKSIIDCHLLSP